jgi:hypothetical protein
MNKLGPKKQAWKPRFLEKVGLPSGPFGCMEWQGSFQSTGYGRFGLNTGYGPTVWFAHRLAYEYWVGPIPDGLVIDHLCRNPRCVNPEHLEPKTQRGNLLAPGSQSPTAKRAAVTHCPRGHEYTEENTRRKKINGTRQCKACDSYYNARRGSRGD